MLSQTCRNLRWAHAVVEATSGQPWSLLVHRS